MAGVAVAAPREMRPRLSAVVSGADQTGLNKVMETHTGGRFDVCKVTRKQLECVDTVVGGAS